MRLADLQGKNIVILGTGREGKAAAKFIAPLPFVFADDRAGEAHIDGVNIVRGTDVHAAIANADVIIKSPGISLYDERFAGKCVTSLMNLWFGENTHTTTICITATKGKSTTSSLLYHVLKALGKNVQLCGNIGTALSREAYGADIVVVEVSSYQAANFDGVADIAALLNLYDDHFDWHKGRAQYHADKLNILRHAKRAFMGAQAFSVTGDLMGAEAITPAPHLPNNDYLKRTHNAHNVAAVLAITNALGITDDAALGAMENFKGLMHRQYSLGEKDGVLYVDDSIATTPASTLAALGVFKGKPTALIAGGHDRGIDYAPLIDGILAHDVHGVVCLGMSGERIYALLQDAGFHGAHKAANMDEAVRISQGFVPHGGVVLLSPAAPSYGMFTDFQARGEAFAFAAGFCKDRAP